MFDVGDIHSLTDFTRNTKRHVKRLKETNKPEILTVNGKAEIVVQDAAAYQRLLDEVDYAQTVRTLRQRLESYHGGEEGIPLDESFSRIRSKLGLSGKS